MQVVVSWSSWSLWGIASVLLVVVVVAAALFSEIVRVWSLSLSLSLSLSVYVPCHHSRIIVVYRRIVPSVRCGAQA